MSAVVGLAILAWAAAYASVALYSVLKLRALRGHEHAPARTARTILVRPCSGDEPRLHDALASTRHLHTRSPLHVVLAVRSEDDAAAPTAREVVSELLSAGISAELALTGADEPNRKAGQVARVLAGRDPFDAVVIADSDVDLAGVDLDALTAPLGTRARGDGAVGAVWAPPVEVGRARGLGDRASQALLGASLHAFPLLGGLDRGGLVGKLVAVDRAALEQVGGFQALTHVLGEDMDLSRRLRGAGFDVEMAPTAARSLAEGRDVGAAIARYSRWIQVIRAQRPSLLPSYPLLMTSLPLLCASAACIAVAPWLGLAALTLALAARLGVAVVARRVAGRVAGGALSDTLTADALLLAAFARACTQRTVAWRGRSLEILPGGLIVDPSVAGRPA